MKVLLSLLFALSAFGADSQFNGRWDIKVSDEPRGRAWWLEVQGAGTPQIRGKFVGAPGGQLDEIPEIAVKDSELVFSFERVYRGVSDKPVKATYRARLSGDKLIGTTTFEGNRRAPIQWVGMRAPELPEKDDGRWKKGKVIELFNGKDLSGWSPVAPNGQLRWVVRNGLLANLEGAGDIASHQKFMNFDLHVEYRIEKGSNSGVGLRGRYEVQIFDDYGKPPAKGGNGALYSRIVPKVNASKAPGEWQTLDVRLIGREVTVTLNGQKIIDRGIIEGLTAMATDPYEAEPGPITLQGDHGAVQFRRIAVTPLTR
jgi:Domain of Unknown Function (DUF1080).